MRDLNLGPDTRKLADNFRALDRDQRTIEAKANELYSAACQMTNMLERWLTVGWCWPDACPAAVCGGPHVEVEYEFDKTNHPVGNTAVIEPYNKIGTTFPEVPYHVVTNTQTGRTRRA
jgi:hypothetical protein